MIILSVASARPDSQTDLVLTSALNGSFTDLNNLQDHLSDTYASSLQTINYLEIALPATLYIRELSLIFVSSNYRGIVSIENRLDNYNGYPLSNNPVIYLQGDENYPVTINIPGLNLPARKIRIKFEPLVSSNAQFKLSAVNVFPAMDIWPEARAEKIEILTDTEVLLSFTSNLYFNGSLEITNLHSGQVRFLPALITGTKHTQLIHDLEPNTEYLGRLVFTDFHGNISNSPSIKFKTLNNNLLLKKPVSGNFTAFQPDDEHILKSPNPLELVNDGSDSYFDSMVTSESLENSDQYLIFDLGKKTNLKRLYIFWRALAYSRDYQISISDDLQQWLEISAHEDAANGYFCYSRTGDPILIKKHLFFEQKIHGKYLKITAPKGSAHFARESLWEFVQIMEIKAFSK